MFNLSSINLHCFVTVNTQALLGLARQLSENKPKGMSKSDIDRLVTYQYAVSDSDAKRSTGDTSESQISCVVCMCDFSQRQRVRELPCQHIFHAKCIDKWLKVELIIACFSLFMSPRANHFLLWLGVNEFITYTQFQYGEFSSLAASIKRHVYFT